MDRETKELQQVSSIDQENTNNLSNRTHFLKDDCTENSQVEGSNQKNHDNNTNFNSKNEPVIIESDQTKVSVSGNEVPDEDGNHTKEIEIDLNVHDESVMGEDPSLYDDVMGTAIIRDCRGTIKLYIYNLFCISLGNFPQAENLNNNILLYLKQTARANAHLSGAFLVKI